MKRLIALLVLLPLLLSVRVTRTTAAELDNGVVAVSETVIDMPVMGLVSPNAVCKSQAHRIDYVKDGVVVAWTKLTLTNACWSVCGVSLGNSTRSHWGASGWTLTWGASSLGGRGCGSNPVLRSTYDNISGPGVKYQAFQQGEVWIDSPLKIGWYWWSVKK